MATTGASFIFQNSQAALDGTAVTAIPYVAAYERQSALSLAGQARGGGSYLGTGASVTNNIALLDQQFSCANDGYAKHGVINVTLNGTLAATIQLANTLTAVTNQLAVSTAGDTVFAVWNVIQVYNLSGVDGNTGETLTIASAASNGANWPVAGSNACTVNPSSRTVFENTGNGYTVNATKTGLTITGNGGNVAVVISGS